MNKHLTGLNSPQLEAVLTTDGPVLILAGAGSGKTRVLTHRIAYLIEEQGVDPWNILAITFTNKAADEMKRRVLAMTEEGSGVFVATFHAACVRILRGTADLLGYGKDFTIYDTDDQKALMRQIIKQKDFDPKLYREKEILRRISSLKNEMTTADQYAYETRGQFREQRIAELYQEYQKRLLAANAMDFDDLLLNTVDILKQFPDVLMKYRHRFRYILVDEYQDTNTAQFQLVELLAHEHRNICVVGDDDQSIYKFRGANIGNILNFEEAFPGAKVIRLEQNYRSTKNILAAANAVIANNTERKSKTLWSDKAEGEKVIFRQFETASDEARSIVKDIAREKERYPYGSCAILYRTNSQSRALEEAFVNAGLPYKLIGGTNFYDRREVKDILSYLKTVANGADDVALRRIVNVPRRGIGDTTLERLADFAAVRDITLYEAMRRVEENAAVKHAAAVKIRTFVQLIEGLREQAGKLRVAELIDRILEVTAYEDALRQEEDDIEAAARLENIRELQNKAVDFQDEAGDPEGLSRFLEEVALVADVDSLSDEEERVVLMTLHSAKGLEFPKVYIAGMEQGLFPGTQNIYSADPSDLEEERRLCYVGFTRAKEKLVLTAAKLRMVNGEMQYHNISQFVEEVPDSLLKKEGSGFMETREESRRRQEKRGDYGYPGGRDRKTEEPWYHFGRDHETEELRSSFRRTGDAPAWQDFGDSFGFGAGSSFRTKKTSPPRDEAQDSYFGMKKPDPAGSTAAAGELKPGDRVSQKRFGEGTVVKVAEGKRDLEVTVDFDKYGQKVMLAGFAGFTKLS